MKHRKIINDPVYGFITVPFDSLLQIIAEPVFQRLRRIKQLGLTDYVYPGAVHTRFHHALGAMHLMVEALKGLKNKGVKISDDEAEAACIAILLHDIGHGPYSHALEGKLIPLHHEDIGLAFMHQLNEKFHGQLSMAIDMFNGEYTTPFYHELISGQLDMDRMDYLTRDSFFTGVAEGVIGYDRIIKMLNVDNGHLVVEEKAMYSIEKFLMARKLMYWQVYLHRAVLSAETMLKEFWDRIIRSDRTQDPSNFSKNLLPFTQFVEHDHSQLNKEKLIQQFSYVDDYDMMYTIKQHVGHDDPAISLLASGLTNRRLFQLKFIEKENIRDFVQELRLKYDELGNELKSTFYSLITEGLESTSYYTQDEEEILMLKKDKIAVPFSHFKNIELGTKKSVKYFVCYPKLPA